MSCRDHHGLWTMKSRVYSRQDIWLRCGHKKYIQSFDGESLGKRLHQRLKWMDGQNWPLLATWLHAGFLLSLFFDPEDGGGMFLQNISWLPTIAVRTSNSTLFEYFRHHFRRSAAMVLIHWHSTFKLGLFIFLMLSEHGPIQRPIWNATVSDDP
jgi:hypothetical protein